MTENGAAAARELIRDLALPAQGAGRASWLDWGMVDDNVDVVTICQFLFLAAFAEGREPHAHHVSIPEFRKGEWRLPEGARVLRETRTNARTVYAVGDGWSLLLRRYYPGHGEVQVTARDEETARRVCLEAARLVRRRSRERDDRVTLGFWHSTPKGAVNQERAIEAPNWSELRGNYTAPVATQFERLMRLKAADVNGKLILLHGPPGTGKTTALRALGRSWRKWCRTDCVLDPERLLSEPGYLLEVVAGEADEDRRWRLLILEDCDELIRGEAKHTAGQALSRLLNLTDGLLGQGQNILVAITTNEPLDRLHPAVVRPGRCLAQIEVGPLSGQEAAAWLDNGERMARPMTLAELYALKAGREGLGTITAEPTTGQYL
ncbi:MAG TPA: DUF5925 domain-containing protein [Actinospica sp.]|nr:DUF5925 domain-containing protein [Actinospica sp.]